MSKMEGLQQALKNSSGKTATTAQSAPDPAATVAAPAATPKPAGRQGKENIGAWLNPDFSTSLRLVQLRRGRDSQGRKVYLDDLFAEALNDLFIKYDVPTVHHE